MHRLFTPHVVHLNRNSAMHSIHYEINKQTNIQIQVTIITILVELKLLRWLLNVSFSNNKARPPAYIPLLLLYGMEYLFLTCGNVIHLKDWLRSATAKYLSRSSFHFTLIGLASCSFATEPYSSTDISQSLCLGPLGNTQNIVFDVTVRFDFIR